MLIGFYVIAGLVTVAMSYTGVTWCYYFGLFVMAYATLIIGDNYAKARQAKNS